MRKKAHRKQKNASRLPIIIFVAVAVFLALAIGTRAYWATLLTSQPVTDVYGRGVSINDKEEILIMASAFQGNEWKHPVIWNNISGNVEKEILDISDMYEVFESPNVFNNKTEFIGTDISNGVRQPMVWHPDSGIHFIRTGNDTIEGSNFQPMAINNNSQIAGYYTGPDGCQHIFVWANGQWSTFDNSNLFCEIVIPRDINDNGVITGYTTRNIYDPNDPMAREWKAFILNTATNAYSEIVSPSFKEITPWSINNNNQVVGEAIERSSQFSLAFLWSNGTYTNLGTLGGNTSIAYTINDAQNIAGRSYTRTGEYHAFVIENNKMVDLGVLDSGPGAISNAFALSINTEGLVVGTNESYDSTREPPYFESPVLWDYIRTKIKKPKNFRNPHNTPTPTPRP